MEMKRDCDATDGAGAARMEPLAVLPVFLKLAGKRAVIVGGNEPALWKAELLAAAGAEVDVIAERFYEGFERLSLDMIRLVRRPWRPEDLRGAAIAIGAMTADEEASTFAAAAHAEGVPVNVIDRPRFCDFQFGAIANRSPLIVAISTDGAAPVLGQALRSEIEVMLPETLRDWVAVAAEWRRELEAKDMPLSERRDFWGRFADLARIEGSRPPTENDFKQLLSKSAKSQGQVTVVSLGRGGVDSLTVAGIRALRTADSIVYDDASAPALAFARREAVRTAALKDAAAQTAKLAFSGKRVVRVLDASTEAEGIEIKEVTQLRALGIDPVILPVTR